MNLVISTYLFLTIVLIVFSFLITDYLIPNIIKIGSQLGIKDLPDSRKKHEYPIVRIGGLAIFCATTICIAITFLLCVMGVIDPLPIGELLIVSICSTRCVSMKKSARRYSSDA